MTFALKVKLGLTITTYPINRNVICWILTFPTLTVLKSKEPKVYFQLSLINHLLRTKNNLDDFKLQIFKIILTAHYLRFKMLSLCRRVELFKWWPQHEIQTAEYRVNGQRVMKIEPPGKASGKFTYNIVCGWLLVVGCCMWVEFFCQEFYMVSLCNIYFSLNTIYIRVIGKG